MGRGILMGRWLLKASELALLLILSLPLSGQEQETDIKTARKTQEEAIKRSKLMKPHFANGNQAMHDAQTIRQQLQTATSDQKPQLLSKMKADYQTAITEYEQALQETEARDENGVQVIGLIGVIRNGLVSQQKAVDMLLQDKDLPVILSNLGMAYGGLGEYQEAITMLQQAAILKPVAGTYMELGTDLAQVGKMPEATATCDKILTVEPVTNTIDTKQEYGKIVYVLPPGTVEAYQRYLQLEPNGPYAGQARAALEGFAKLKKPVSKSTEEKN